MAKVHIVSGYWDHEGSSAVAAFDSKPAAEAFIERCKAHEAKRPLWPAEADETAVDAYIKKDNRWMDRHPAGKGIYSFDGYVIFSTRLRATASLEGQKP